MKVGKISENIWKRSVRKMLPDHMLTNEGAGIGRDCALFHNVEEKYIINSEDCVIPYCERMGAIGVYTATNLIAGNLGNPKSVMLSLFLDGRTGEDFLKHVAHEAGETAKQLGIVIGAFDVHVLHGLKKPYLLCSAQGYGNFENKTDLKGQMDLVISGFVGLSGTAMILADEKMRNQLLQRYPKKYINDAIQLSNNLSVIDHIKNLSSDNICYIRALGEAGINRALSEMAEVANTGLEVYLKKIPIMQETVELCNHFDINPYELHSSGALLIGTNDGKAVVDLLLKAGINAEIIGSIRTDNDKLIINEDEKRFITLPQTDGIYEFF